MTQDQMVAYFVSVLTGEVVAEPVESKAMYCPDCQWEITYCDCPWS